VIVVRVASTPSGVAEPPGRGRSGDSPTPVGAHLPALDGWRGIAVAAVVAFHAELFPGGWLGVDLFFVLSGFLITRLLLAEHGRRDRIALGGFWSRRARRLLPALVLFFVGVAAYAAWYPDPVGLPDRLTAEMGATAAYVANWFQLFSTSGYWDTFTAVSPLKHMWSLAIEEQFYILFPLVMIGLLGMARLSARRVAMVLGLGAVVSWSAGFVLLARGAAFERVYLGTDTRIGAILIGAAAGAATQVPGLAPRLSGWARRAALPIALVVLVLLVVVDGAVEWPAWRWAVLPLFELGVCVLLVHAADGAAGRSPVHRAVATVPLIWLGTISYGLYLWHFPALAAAERAMADQPRWMVIVVAVGAALVLAQLSLVLLERPVRAAQLSRGAWVLLGAVGVLLVAASIWSVWRSTEAAREYQERRPDDREIASSIVEADGAPLRPSTTVASAGLDPALPPPPQPSLPLPRPAGRPARMLLLGDSMAFDLNPGLQAVADRSDVVLSTASMVGCSAGGMDAEPGVTGGLGSPELVQRCDDWLATWGDLAATAAPDVALVVRTSARRADAGTGGGEDQCSPQYQDWYRDAVTDEAVTLGEHAGVVVLTSNVYSRWGERAFDDIDDFTECRNRVLAEVADSLDHVVYLPLGEWACPTRTTCVDEVEGDVLRPDGLHFQDAGAEHASRWIMSQLYGS
jgi:peptidoglycan/LPS O-acetylase OafA/YrhL